MPIAKFDEKGKLITSKYGILSLYEKEYKERLSKTRPHEGYDKLMTLKEYLFSLRLKISSRHNISDWKVSDIEKICQSVKNKKARDKDGLIYEPFKPLYCGADMSLSLTKMFNLIRQTLSIPSFFENVRITSIPKITTNQSPFYPLREEFSMYQNAEV